MSESYREQFPLLCDDLSDEEHYSPHYHRQYRQMTYRSRGRSNLKGAVAILKRWPEHWSSFLTYWWIGVVMICLMTFILYNSLFAFTILPTAHFKPLKSQVPNLNTVQTISPDISQFPNVYTHVFTDDMKKIDINKYLPHIRVMANKYSTYNYHLVVVVNDTSADSAELSPGENNLNALNALWTKDIITTNDQTFASNIKIEHISLTKYMDNSPISKYWRTLSNEIVEFLVRAVSIWDKGGITFNPLILTPQSTNSTYIIKLENILKTFGNSESKSLHNKTQNSSIVTRHKFKQKVNNIRDVINAIENENNLDFSDDEILAEAEANNVGFVSPRMHKKSTSSHKLANRSVSNSNYSEKPLIYNELNQEKTESNQAVSNSNNSSNLTILPAFLDYLLHRSANSNQNKEESSGKDTKNFINYISKENYSITDDVNENKNDANPITKKSVDVDKTWLSPMIIPVDEVNLEVNEVKNDDTYKQFASHNGDQRLTLDIKGNLLATKTACHAFLGTMFTDAIHCGYKERASDFIIKELSIFCNGVLSSCNGIDIIIL